MNPIRTKKQTVFAALLCCGGLAAATPTPATAQPPANAIIVTDTNDVMDGKTPKLPAFSKLARKPGYLRGCVKDANGKPLAGAYVMVVPAALVSPTSLYGVGTKQSVTVRTDANGLYEVKIPTGGCQVWCAGYALDYHGVRLALPLHPADGELDNLNKAQGDIENFVLLPYGVANPSGVSENPVYSGNYYGGTFTVGYSTREANDTFSPAYWLTLGSVVEITLTPDGPLVGGGAGRPIVIRKKLDYNCSSYFQVNNVPIGRYKIQARLIENGNTVPIRLKENVGSPPKGGLNPKETEDEATLLFRSDTGDPKTLRVPKGNMGRLELLIERAAQ
jgi:hypothetical protein